jgi:hypothetical protein
MTMHDPAQQGAAEGTGVGAMEILTDIPVDLSLETIAPRVRVVPGSADASTLAALLDRVRPVAKPKAIYALCFIEERAEAAVNVGGVVFESRVLRVNLDGLHRVFPYIVTCGAELDDPRGLANDPLESYWLDEVRLAALGAGIEHLRQRIEERYQPGKLSSMSPGSLADWPISQQPKLFSLFGNVEAKIGVALTDSYLMLPLKSVSGMYFATETDFTSCRLCPRRHCISRQAAYDETLWVERYGGQG